MEKEKLKNLSHPGWLQRPGWMHHRWFAYYMGIMFFIGGVIHILNTETAGIWFKTSGWNFAILFLGFLASFPADVLYSLVDPGLTSVSSIYLIPSPQTILIRCLILLGISTVTVLLLHLLQQFRRPFKVLVYLNFLPHMLVGVLLILQGINQVLSPSPRYTPVTRPISQFTCEYTVSDTIKIRANVSGWYLPPMLRGAHQYQRSRFSISTDSGNTWHEFMLLFSRCAYYPVKTGYLNDQVFWLWTASWVLFTADGGATWQVQDVYDKRLPQTGVIADVAFETSQKGHLTMWISTRDRHKHFQLQVYSPATTDGGLTWQLPDSEAAKIEKAS